MSRNKCPKCHFEFDGERYFKERVDGPVSLIQNIEGKISEPLFKHRGELDEIAESILTICPNCKTEFPFYEYKLFGFLSSKNFKVIILFCIIAFMIFSVSVLMKDLM